MKKHVFLIALVFVCSCVFAQQDTTTVYSAPGYSKDPLRSKWKKTIEQKDSLWVVNFYDKKDILQEKISFADKKLEIRKGPYDFYDNGNLKEEGNYERGYQNGTWKKYYPNKQLAENANYTWGNLHGIFKSYWDNNQLKKEGKYFRGKKIGVWRLFYPDGKPALKERYTEQGELIDGVYFDKEGKSVNSISVIQPPSYPGGMQAFNRFLGKAIRYPANAVKNKIEGTVKLEFTVMKDGKIDDIKVKESPGAELSREAVKVLNASTNWISAKELGEPVNMRYMVPIKFSLHD
ncbi:TonB family protein [Pedobacter sp. LMG 31464]|uniref:TonB family protein n=1 Tax=Pedobacter planticolens TaxID=2679964 RepID=A0A923E0R4_9SPHI|nr:energy transducer TonB [Pedobacter planticolens]MBB2146135.1 TonB family protein [Pedobacter planticolens]